MKPPYTVQPERHDGFGDYEADGLPSVFDDVESARAHVRRVTEQSGIVPRVIDGRGVAIQLHTCAEVARWA